MRTQIPHPQREANYRGQERADDLIGWLRHYGDQRVNSRLMDQRRSIPPYIILDFGNRGVLGMTTEQHHGGLGLSYRDCFRVYEQLASVDSAIASMITTHEFVATRAIRYASAEMQSACLPMLATGRHLGAFAFTELQAASNPKGIRSQAKPNGRGGWELNGSKTWISSGNWGGIISVYVQQRDEQDQPCGFSGFVLQQGMAGLKPAQEAMTMGIRASAQNVVHFQGVQVGPEHLLGTLGDGMDIALDVMMMGRIGLGAVCLGGIKRCLQLMLRLAGQRQSGTGLLLENPVAQVRMGELTTAVTAFESLIHLCADSLDRELPLPEAFYSACKVVGSELFGKAADTLIQLAGSRGFMETNGIPQLYRDARAFRIVEGTSETLIMHVGSSICNKGEPLYQFMEEHLHCPVVVSTLQEAIDQIQHQLPAQFEDCQQNLRWIHTCAGEITMKALVWAACASTLHNQPVANVPLQLAHSWAKDQFDHCLQTILQQSASSREQLSLGELQEFIRGFSEQIGDIQQSLPGEDWSLDPILRKAEPDQVEASSEVSSQQSPEAVEATPGHTVQPAIASHELIAWIQNWLVQSLKMPADKLYEDSAFADLGLDSVTSVELVADLEKHLGCYLDETLLWNYPTISSLVEYLLTEVSEKGQVVVGASEQDLSGSVN